MSTIKVTNIEHENTTNGGIQLDNAGHVTVDGQQMPTAGALSNRNLIINGAMQVAQRGTANATPVGYQTVDRFKANASGGTFSQERIDLTSSDSPYSSGFRHAFRVKNSAVATANNHYRQFEQAVEAQDARKCGWNYNSTSSYVTISFWARASVSGTYCFDFRSHDGTAQAYPTSITLVADTWKKFELTYPGDSGITINDDSGIGLRLVWGVYFGSNFTDSSAVMGQWHAFSSATICPDDTAGWGTTLNATFDVTGVQLEVGEKATPFEHRNFGDELQRCERYFQQWKGDGTASTQNVICGAAGINSGASACYLVPSPKMRGPFSVDFDNLIISDSATYDEDVTAMNLTNPSGDGAYVTASHASNGGRHDAQSLRVKAGTAGYLRLDAEL